MLAELTKHFELTALAESSRQWAEQFELPMQFELTVLGESRRQWNEEQQLPIELQEGEGLELLSS